MSPSLTAVSPGSLNRDSLQKTLSNIRGLRLEFANLNRKWSSRTFSTQISICNRKMQPQINQVCRVHQLLPTPFPPSMTPKNRNTRPSNSPGPTTKKVCPKFEQLIQLENPFCNNFLHLIILSSFSIPIINMISL